MFDMCFQTVKPNRRCNTSFFSRSVPTVGCKNVNATLSDINREDGFCAEVKLRMSFHEQHRVNFWVQSIEEMSRNSSTFGELSLFAES